MIKAEKGAVCLSGSIPLVMAELTSVLRAIREYHLDSGYDEITTKGSIEKAVQLTFSSDKELKKEEKETKEKLKKLTQIEKDFIRSLFDDLNF